MGQAFFVTGTGTDVGKTYFSSLFMAKYGENLGYSYWKPIQTGIDQADDTTQVQDQTGLPVGHFLAPVYRFRHPSSPHFASLLENVSISDSLLLQKVREIRKQNVLVEGAGGLHVPLTDSLLTWQFLQKSNLPAVLVVRSELGTINHSLLTLESLQYHSLPVLGFYMIGVENELRLDNIRSIEKWGGAPCLGFTALPSGKLDAMSFQSYAQSSFDVENQIRSLLLEEDTFET